MRARGAGSVVNITALSAIEPIPGFGLSVATWVGVIGLAKTLPRELARGIPLGHVDRPEDAASVVAFLVSPRGRYVTGATIPVDGGLRRGLL